MNPTVLAAIAAVVVGLFVAGGSTAALIGASTPRNGDGAAPVKGRPATVPAAAGTALGLLLTAAGVALLAWWLATGGTDRSTAGTGATGRLPLTTAATTASAAGVVSFTILGAAVALFADATERRRNRRLDGTGGAGTSDGDEATATADEWPAAAAPGDGTATPADPAGPAAPVDARLAGLGGRELESGRGAEVDTTTGTDDPAVWMDVEPGYIYADDEGGWYLAVGDGEHRSRLVELPGFALAGGAGRRRPGPLRRSGAAELTVATDQEVAVVTDH